MKIRNLKINENEWKIDENARLIYVKNDRGLFPVCMKTLFRLDIAAVDEGFFGLAATVRDVDLSCVCEKNDDLFEISLTNETIVDKRSDSVAVKRRESVVYRCVESHSELPPCVCEFLAGYLVPSYYRRVCAYDGYRPTPYTQSVLDYWAEKYVTDYLLHRADDADAESYQKAMNAIEVFAFENPYFKVGKKTMRFFRDGGSENEYYFSLDSDENPTEEEKKELSFVDFLVADRLLEATRRPYGRTDPPPLFIEDLFDGLSKEKTKKYLAALVKTGRQTFVVDRGKNPFVESLCDETIDLSKEKK